MKSLPISRGLSEKLQYLFTSFITIGADSRYFLICILGSYRVICRFCLLDLKDLAGIGLGGWVLHHRNISMCCACCAVILTLFPVYLKKVTLFQTIVCIHSVHYKCVTFSVLIMSTTKSGTPAV